MSVETKASSFVECTRCKLLLQLPPLVEPLIGGRCRIDPSVIPQLAAYIIVLRSRHDILARKTLRGLKGAERERTAAQCKYEKTVVRAYDEILRSIIETVPLDQYEKSRLVIEAVIAKGEKGGA